MSVEADFRALLAADAGVLALVAGRIAVNAVPEGSDYPLITFGVAHDRTLGLNGSLLADECEITVACWAKSSLEASAVADAVIAAVATAAADKGACVLSRTTAFEDELALDGVLLVVEWWG